MKILQILLVSSIIMCTANALSEKPFVVVIPSYNNGAWYKKNLDSVCMQDYSNFRIIYIDDASTDNTSSLVSQYIESCPLKKKFTLLKNQQRTYKMANLFYAIHSCTDDEIVVELDGDDWLADATVLKKLNLIYQNPQIWLTYGNYQEFPSGGIGGYVAEIPKDIIENNLFRSFQWVTGHLRTYYSWLFKLIKQEHLLYKNQFVQVVADVAIMLPMLEMAGERFKYNNQVFYIYNTDTPINDHKVSRALISEVETHVRNLPKYTRLEKKPFKTS